MTDQGVAGAILAGGRGRRMGGEDKGLIPFRGRPLVAHLIERLAPQVDELLISANRNLDAYQALGLPVVSDDLEGFQGPLAGILAVLRRVQRPWLVVVPCDTPLVPSDLVTRLLEAARRQDRPAAVVHDGRRLQPLHLLLATDLADDLSTWLDDGGRRLESWLERHQPAVADFSDQPEAFANLNTPEALAGLEREWS